MQRTIKSYVLRGGRISKRQELALEKWSSEYILSSPYESLDIAKAFGRDAATIVEIGFGMGVSLAAMAKAQQEYNFLGIEVHRAGIANLVAQLHSEEIKNVRVATVDAVEVFNKYLPDNILAGVQIFFPDPWPKKRHHKRRLIQSDFVSLLVKKIKIGGFIHCATDWHDYAQQMLVVLNEDPNLCNQQIHGSFSPRPITRPVTKFEQRGYNLGHKSWDLIFNRTR